MDQVPISIFMFPGSIGRHDMHIYDVCVVFTTVFMLSVNVAQQTKVLLSLQCNH